MNSEEKSKVVKDLLLIDGIFKAPKQENLKRDISILQNEVKSLIETKLKDDEQTYRTLLAIRFLLDENR